MPDTANPAPGAYEIDLTHAAAATVHTYIDGGGLSMDAALGAYAQLAVAASIDALRAVVSEQLDAVAEKLAEISERLDALDDI